MGSIDVSIRIKSRALLHIQQCPDNQGAVFQERTILLCFSRKNDHFMFFKKERSFYVFQERTTLLCFSRKNDPFMFFKKERPFLFFQERTIVLCFQERTIVLFKKGCHQRGDFHCRCCEKVYMKKKDLLSHLNKDLSVTPAMNFKMFLVI